MGTWGAGPFDNDNAADWLADLGTQATPQQVREAVLRAIDALQGAWVEAPDAQVGIAAAEVVAGAHGRWTLTMPAPPWLSSVHGIFDPSSLDRCRHTVRSIRDRSELRELWDETGPEDWLDAIDDLQRRLSDAP